MCLLHPTLTLPRTESSTCGQSQNEHKKMEMIEARRGYCYETFCNSHRLISICAGCQMKNFVKLELWTLSLRRAHWVGALIGANFEPSWFHLGYGWVGSTLPSLEQDLWMGIGTPLSKLCLRENISIAIKQRNSDVNIFLWKLKNCGQRLSLSAWSGFCGKRCEVDNVKNQQKHARVVLLVPKNGEISSL